MEADGGRTMNALSVWIAYNALMDYLFSLLLRRLGVLLEYKMELRHLTVFGAAAKAAVQFASMDHHWFHMNMRELRPQ